MESVTFEYSYISLWRETFSGYEPIRDDDFTTYQAFDIIHNRCWMSNYLDWLVILLDIIYIIILSISLFGN